MRYAQVEENLRKLVEEVVMRILKGRLLVIFTGGVIGLEMALEQLEETIAHEKINVDLLFSAAGSKIHDIQSIKDKLKADKVYIEGRERIDDLKNYTGIVFTVLSRNTASKAANLILDGHIVELMIDALMLGIPIVAPKDAADIGSQEWSKLGYRWANTNLRSAFSKNLSILQDYGVNICASDELRDTVGNVIFGCTSAKDNTETSPKTSVVRINKNLITRKDIVPYLDMKHEIYIPGDVLITPLAQDIIRDFDLKIIRE